MHGNSICSSQEGKNLSPAVLQQLENSEKDAHSCNPLLKAPKSNVWDNKTIPLLMAQVSETEEAGASAREHTLSFYEVLARVHGRSIVPQIDSIMSTIVKTLSSGVGSSPPHQACSKLVLAIARYAIDPLTTGDEKARIISCLCKPLSDVLMASTEGVASGAAACLKALVESDNWQFASDDTVNEVCLNVAGAMEEKLTQSTAHIGLAMALLKHNGFIVDAYARSLLRSGVRILTTAAAAAESNSQKRFSAIQMINFLMKCVDSRSIASELDAVAKVLENCHTDRMPFVRDAAFEAFQTAKVVATQNGSKCERGSSSIYGKQGYKRRMLLATEDAETLVGGSSYGFASPKSQTPDTFVTNESFTEFPLSMGQSSCNFERARHANRRPWNSENDLDVLFRNGLTTRPVLGSNSSKQYSGDVELGDSVSQHSAAFSRQPTMDTIRPRRPHSPCSVNNMKVSTTPRKLIRSPQDPIDADSGCCVKKCGSVRDVSSSTSDEVDWDLLKTIDGGVHSHNLDCEIKTKRRFEDTRMTSELNAVRDGEFVFEGSESVSSSCGILSNTICKISSEAAHQDKVVVQSLCVRKRGFNRLSVISVFILLLILLAINMFVMKVGDDEHFSHEVPT